MADTEIAEDDVRLSSEEKAKMGQREERQAIEPEERRLDSGEGQVLGSGDGSLKAESSGGTKDITPTYYKCGEAGHISRDCESNQEGGWGYFGKHNTQGSRVVDKYRRKLQEQR
jgi:Zinc knuckle